MTSALRATIPDDVPPTLRVEESGERPVRRNLGGALTRVAGDEPLADWFELQLELSMRVAYLRDLDAYPGARDGRAPEDWRRSLLGLEGLRDALEGLYRAVREGRLAAAARPGSVLSVTLLRVYTWADAVAEILEVVRESRTTVIPYALVDAAAALECPLAGGERVAALLVEDLVSATATSDDDGEAIAEATSAAARLVSAAQLLDADVRAAFLRD